MVYKFYTFVGVWEWVDGVYRGVVLGQNRNKFVAYEDSSILENRERFKRLYLFMAAFNC